MKRKSQAKKEGKEVQEPEVKKSKSGNDELTEIDIPKSFTFGQLNKTKPNYRETNRAGYHHLHGCFTEGDKKADMYDTIGYIQEELFNEETGTDIMWSQVVELAKKAGKGKMVEGKDLRHGDLVDFGVYRGTGAFVAHQDGDDFRLIKTLGEMGYCVTPHFADAPWEYFETGHNSWGILELCIDPSRTIADSSLGKVLLEEIEREKDRLNKVIAEKKANPGGSTNQGRGGRRQDEDAEEKLKNFPQNFFAYYDSEDSWRWVPKEQFVEEEVSDCMDGIHQVVYERFCKEFDEEMKTNKLRNEKALLQSASLNEHLPPEIISQVTKFVCGGFPKAFCA